MTNQAIDHEHDFILIRTIPYRDRDGTETKRSIYECSCGAGYFLMEAL